MYKPEYEYCCTGGDMHTITDDDDDIIGYICSSCGRVYKYVLIKES